MTINAVPKAMNTCDVNAAPREDTDSKNVTETSHDSSMNHEVKIIETPLNAAYTPNTVTQTR